jgi:hypothetical protein
VAGVTRAEWGTTGGGPPRSAARQPRHDTPAWTHLVFGLLVDARYVGLAHAKKAGSAAAAAPAILAAPHAAERTAWVVRRHSAAGACVRVRVCAWVRVARWCQDTRERVSCCVAGLRWHVCCVCCESSCSRSMHPQRPCPPPTHTQTHARTREPLLPLQDHVGAGRVHDVHFAQQRGRQVPHKQAVRLLHQLWLRLGRLWVCIPARLLRVCDTRGVCVV